MGTTSEATRRHAHTRTWLFALAFGALTGCAIGASSGDDLAVTDSAARVDNGDDDDDGDDGDDTGDDADDNDDFDAGIASVSDAGSVKDAGRDGGASPSDAGAKDAGAKDASSDAGSTTGSSSDAGAMNALDAGSPASDAGRDGGSPTPVQDAGRDSGSGGSGARCTQASQCKNDCLVAGPFACCRDNGSCGCTWAPGAYCM